MKNILKKLLLATPFFMACKDGEKPLPVVSSVDVQRYMGTWYEIARLPNSFETGLSDITATYTLREDGKITVLNKGIQADGKLSQAQGIAYVPDVNEPAKLKVSFFRPFYGKYWIIDLDASYNYALVGHPNREYLWILSRTPQLPDTTYQRLLQKAMINGFDTGKIITVKHAK